MKLVLMAFAAAVALLALLLLAALIKTLCTPAKTAQYTPQPDAKREQEYVQKLSRMVQCETISCRGIEDIQKFRIFHEELFHLFPRVFQSCEIINLDGNLIVVWKGRSHQDPIALMSHQDVVAPGSGWSRDPFGGEIDQGKVWGRGTGDTKGSVMAFFQAVEELLEQGYQPAVDVYLLSSCTEEIAGNGGPKIAGWLKQNGIRLFLLCDEGGGIISNPMPGIQGDFALTGLFEKGQGNVRFTAHSHGGHSSMPPKGTPLVRLGQFMSDIEKNDPMKVAFSDTVISMFTRLAPYGDFKMRYLLGNLWLFGPLLKKVMPILSSQGAAMLKTTVAFTQAKGSDGRNIIPDEAWVLANLRFIPHQKSQESLAVLKQRASRYHLEMEVLNAQDPTPSVDPNGAAYKLVEQAIRTTFPGLEAIPYVVTGGTDCRFYQEVCDSTIRFAPLIYGPEQLASMHGIDENIETICLPGAVDFYKNLIQLQEQRLPA